MAQDPGRPEAAKSDIPVTRAAPLPPMQRMAAAHLAESHRETAPVTLLGDVDAEPIEALRARLNRDLPSGSPNRISLTHLLVKACAQALRAHPDVNVGFVDGQRLEWSEINVGVALSTPKGDLIVPVLRRADTKPLSAIVAELADLETRGRAGKLTLAEVKGGTFTLSNAGMVKSARWTTPIIHRPQCAILGIGAIRDAAVVRNGQVVAGRMLPTSLTFDHRLVNGVPASLFVDALHDLIAAPDRLELGP